MPNTTPSASARGARTAEMLLTFDPAVKGGPEGVAVAPDGTVYAGLLYSGEIHRWRPAGATAAARAAGPDTHFAQLDVGDTGMCGFALDRAGVLHVALWSGRAETNGIWRVTPDGPDRGRPERFAAFPPEAGPNEMVLCSDGGLFVTDSPGGAIWRVEPDGTARRWFQSPLLMAPAGAPFPAGANGFDFWGQALYICNTFAQTVVRVPVTEAGTPGPAEVVARDVGISGLRFDARGDLWLATTLFTNALVRLGADGTRETVADGAAGLDCPANLVFSAVPGEETLAYVTNTSAGPFGKRPSLARVDLGVPGRPGNQVFDWPAAAPRAARPPAERTVVSAEMRAVPGRGAELARALRALIADTMAADGPIAYEAAQAADDPDRFVIWEVWPSADVMTAHMSSRITAFLRDHGAIIAGHLATPADIPATVGRPV